eukprot:TRINITY_DN19892_c0_g1_i1.p1 TRINITY_DN19892_c0_g1~~TRINITY_DN19892_c0_g1_i1.p1  ORF type:complete len:1424 (+),score=253.48 TRINITY_DN19892_c0_g1_i1:105-4274(+)
MVSVTLRPRGDSDNRTPPSGVLPLQTLTSECTDAEDAEQSSCTAEGEEGGNFGEGPANADGPDQTPEAADAGPGSPHVRFAASPVVERAESLSVLREHPGLRPVGCVGAARAVGLAPFVKPPRELRDKLPRVAEAFQLFDVDGSGVVTFEEVYSVLSSLGCSLSTEDVDAVIKQVDTSDDGIMSLDEFTTFYLVNASRLDKGRSGPLSKMMRVIEGHVGVQQTDDLTEAQMAAQGRMIKTTKKIQLWLPDTLWRRRWDLFIFGFVYAWLIFWPLLSVVYRFSPVTDPKWAGPIAGIQVVVYTVDFFISLNTCRVADGGRIISNRVAVILRDWPTLLLDLLAAIPADTAVEAAGAPHWVVVLFGTLRALKGLKLFREGKMWQTSNRVPMDTAFVNFYFHTLPFLRFASKVLLFIHYMTCMRMLTAPGTSSRDGKTFTHVNLMDPESRRVERIVELWADALFWVWTLMTTGPAALIVQETADIVYAGILMAIALVLQGILVAKMAVLLLQENVQEQTAEKMRSTLTVLEYYNIPPSLQQEILSYQHHMLSQAAESLAAELSFLPPSMQREVEVYVKMETLSNVKMFASAGHTCRVRLVNALEADLAVPDQHIITAGEVGEEMFFLVHGFADVILPIPGRPVVATLTSGDAFGEIALLSSDCKRTASICALTYCDLLRLDKSDFLDILSEFADFRAIVLLEMKSRGLSDEQRRAMIQRGVVRRRSDTAWFGGPLPGTAEAPGGDEPEKVSSENEVSVREPTSTTPVPQDKRDSLFCQDAPAAEPWFSGPWRAGPRISVHGRSSRASVSSLAGRRRASGQTRRTSAASALSDSNDRRDSGSRGLIATAGLSGRSPLTGPRGSTSGNLLPQGGTVFARSSLFAAAAAPRHSVVDRLRGRRPSASPNVLALSPPNAYGSRSSPSPFTQCLDEMRAPHKQRTSGFFSLEAPQPQHPQQQPPQPAPPQPAPRQPQTPEPQHTQPQPPHSGTRPSISQPLFMIPFMRSQSIASMDGRDDALPPPYQRVSMSSAVSGTVDSEMSQHPSDPPASAKGNRPVLTSVDPRTVAQLAVHSTTFPQMSDGGSVASRRSSSHSSRKYTDARLDSPSARGGVRLSAETAFSILYNGAPERPQSPRGGRPGSHSPSKAPDGSLGACNARPCPGEAKLPPSSNSRGRHGDLPPGRTSLRGVHVRASSGTRQPAGAAAKGFIPVSGVMQRIALLSRKVNEFGAKLQMRMTAFDSCVAAIKTSARSAPTPSRRPASTLGGVGSSLLSPPGRRHLQGRPTSPVAADERVVQRHAAEPPPTPDSEGSPARAFHHTGSGMSRHSSRVSHASSRISRASSRSSRHTGSARAMRISCRDSGLPTSPGIVAAALSSPGGSGSMMRHALARSMDSIH